MPIYIECKKWLRVNRAGLDDQRLAGANITGAIYARKKFQQRPSAG
jgi:hypothetical protein